MRRVGIIGFGQLGKYLDKKLERLLYEVNIYDISLNGFDVIDPMHRRKIVEENDIIINCCAITNVDACRNSEAFDVNCNAVIKLSDLCQERKKMFIHISSDYVYGSNDLNDDLVEDISRFMPRPVNTYGVQKLLADLTIGGRPNTLVLRPSYLFGKDGKQNCIYKLKELMEKNQKLKVTDDQYFIPCSVEVIYQVIMTYLNGRIPDGIYNVRNESKTGMVSRYDIALYIRNVIKCECELVPCKTSEFPTPEQRQLNSFINIDKIRNAVDFQFKDWKDAVKEYLQQ